MSEKTTLSGVALITVDISTISRPALTPLLGFPMEGPMDRHGKQVVFLVHETPVHHACLGVQCQQVVYTRVVTNREAPAKL